MKITYLILVLLLSNFTLPAFAQFGTLDPNFGTGGKVTTDLGSEDTATSTKIQADGKIIVAGYTNVGANLNFIVVRYNTDGSLDNTFNGTGIDTFNIDGYNNLAFATTIQPNGKILVAGGVYFSMCVMRLNENGRPDSTFGINGIAKVNADSTVDGAQGIALQSDGKIILAGMASQLINNVNTYYMVVRFNTNGTIDGSFNNTGVVTTQIGNNRNKAFAVAVQPDDKIVVAGEVYDSNGDEFGLFRYTANGTLDSTFGTNGVDTIKIGKWNSLRSVVVQPDGKILAAGFTQHSDTISALALMRVDSNGLPDVTFGVNGIKTISSGREAAYAVLLQPDHKIVAAGYSRNNTQNNFLLVRTNDDGTLDQTFGDTGTVTTDFGLSSSGYAAALQTDGKIIVAGGSPFAVARYNGTTTLSIATVSPEHYSVYPNPVTNGQFILESTKGEDGRDIKLKIYDMLGNLVYSYNLPHAGYYEVINGCNFTSGMYIISVSDGAQTIQKKITIANY